MSLKFRVLMLLAALFALTLASTAQDQTPAESPEDNACYTGGSLEGKCDWPTEAEDEWAWTCGWYIARAENGIIPQDDVPDWCNYFISSTGPAFSPICYAAKVGGMLDLAQIAPIDTLRNVRLYKSTDGTCTGENFPGTMFRSHIIDLDNPDFELDFLPAFEKCMAITGEVEVFPLPMGILNILKGLPKDYWVCITAADGPLRGIAN